MSPLPDDSSTPVIHSTGSGAKSTLGSERELAALLVPLGAVEVEAVDDNLVLLVLRLLLEV